MLTRMLTLVFAGAFASAAVSRSRGAFVPVLTAGTAVVSVCVRVPAALRTKPTLIKSTFSSARLSRG